MRLRALVLSDPFFLLTAKLLPKGRPRGPCKGLSRPSQSKGLCTGQGRFFRKREFPCFGFNLLRYFTRIRDKVVA